MTMDSAAIEARCSFSSPSHDLAHGMAGRLTGTQVRAALG